MMEYSTAEADKVIADGVVAASELIVVHLTFGEYSQATARYADLKGLLAVLTTTKWSGLPTSST